MDATRDDADSGLERFRSYLLPLAPVRLDPEVKEGRRPDIVQQKLFGAHRDRAGFGGRTVGEQGAWPGQILARNLANLVRDLRRDKPDVAREQPLQAALDESASRLEAWLVAEQSSPSQLAERHERAVHQAEALPALPENQPEAVVLRYWHGRSLIEIGEQLGCTTAAVTGLLHSSQRNLRKQLNDKE
jgi:RNA polymerase sigma-70 factor, ECF subfamily